MVLSSLPFRWYYHYSVQNHISIVSLSEKKNTILGSRSLLLSFFQMRQKTAVDNTFFSVRVTFSFFFYDFKAILKAIF